VALVLAGITVGLVVGEIGLRVRARALTRTSNFLLAVADNYDPVLGWVPQGPSDAEGPAARRIAVYDGIEATLLPGGIRDNGNAPVPERPLVLATGDSYTFGDEVGDSETYPAHLERLLGCRVVNGGVQAYGFDQSVLRAEQLSAEYEPSLIIVGLIPDDIYRCEHGVRGAAKPYFDVEDDEFVLRHSPVPPPAELDMTWAQRWLGHSLVAHHCMLMLHGEEWLLRSVVHGDGGSVAGLLINRLDRFSEQTGIPVIVLVEYSRFDLGSILDRPLAGSPRSLGDLIRVSRDRVHVLDLMNLEPSPAQLHAGLTTRDLHLEGHLSPEGNRRVAERLRDLIVQEGLLEVDAGPR